MDKNDKKRFGLKDINGAGTSASAAASVHGAGCKSFTRSSTSEHIRDIASTMYRTPAARLNFLELISEEIVESLAEDRLTWAWHLAGC